MKKRKAKKGDQATTQVAYELLLDLLTNNQESIEPTLWAGAMIAALAWNFEASGIPFECFKKDMISACDHYKY